MINKNEAVLKEHLQDALTNWVKNSKISGIVRDHSRLMRVESYCSIVVDYNQFPENYVYKHISNDMASFSLRLIKSVEKTMFSTLGKIEPKDYKIQFDFRYYGEMLSKDVNYYLISKVD